MFLVTVFDQAEIPTYTYRINSFFETEAGCKMDYSIFKWSSDILKYTGTTFDTSGKIQILFD